MKIALYVTIFLWSGVKFIVGVGISVAGKLNFWEQAICTITGGITGVTVFAFLGDKIRDIIYRFRGKKPVGFSPRWAYLWQRWGLWGIALLTPPILSPPVGVSIALAFGTPIRKVLFVMYLSMIGWGLLFAAVWQSVAPYVGLG
ncbi:MAG: hypothetical protein ACUVRD_04605 [Bacteroidia bacterium]